jgi:hypothetical protein
VLGDKRAFDTGVKIANDMTLPAKARSEALDIVASTGKGNPRAFPVIFEKFKQALASNNELAMLTALGALIQIADPRGQQAIELLKVKYKDNPAELQNVVYFEELFKIAIKQ